MVKPHSAFARLALVGAFGLLLFACTGKADPVPADKPVPTGQYGVVTFGEHSTNEGERLFGEKCAFCHVGAKNTGAMMLGRRLGKAHAELTSRTDLDPDYVKAVVRNGLVNMPPINRVELTDAQLDEIAAFLARKDGK